MLPERDTLIREQAVCAGTDTLLCHCRLAWIGCAGNGAA